jgi:hypothetical protein
MRQKSNSTPASSETLVRDIRRATRKHHTCRSSGPDALEDKPSKPDRAGNRIPDDVRQRCSPSEPTRQIDLSLKEKIGLIVTPQRAR